MAEPAIGVPHAKRVGEWIDAGFGAPGPHTAPPLKLRRASRPPEPDPPSKLSARWRRRLATAESVAMWLAGASAFAWIALGYERSLDDPRAMPGLAVYGDEVGGLEAQEIQAAADAGAQARLDRPLALVAGERRFETRARELGAEPATEGAAEAVLAYGREGGLFENLRARAQARAGMVDMDFGLDFDTSIARAYLQKIAPELDLAPTPQRLDLDARQIIPAKPGQALLADASLSWVAAGLASDAESIELAMLERPPILSERDRRIAELDISVLLGEFTTPYGLEPRYRDRTHNLKLGAAAIDGTIIEPGETWSFNETVGARSAEAGYRYAPGINAGELVDSLGGGICQVASSIFGAGFFGGLEVVNARPHSRPSSYVDMGLDATVVWPNVDLKIKNGYDFPVVLHMTVNQGRVVAQVLGPRRPYQVVFERELKQANDFEVVQRGDDSQRSGTKRVSQRGVRGFTLERRRVFMAGGKEVKSENWTLTYPPTRQIEYVGTNPNGSVPEAKEFPERREPDKDLRILQ